MTRAVKAVSTYRGRDPRDFALVAFGGNGPVVAVAIARELEMRRVLIPPAPGVFSAAGLLFSNVEHTQQRSVFQRASAVDAGSLQTAFGALTGQVMEEMRKEGIAEARVTLKRLADLRYTGQAFELSVPVEEVDLARIEAAFHAEHKRTYGHSSEGDPVDLINIRVVASAAPESKEGFAERLKDAQVGAVSGGRRQAYFDGRMVDTPVLARSALAKPMQGPLIIEEFDATCVIPPGARAELDAHGNIVIDT
jgi:N-methylhydantoinase A